MGRSQVSNRSVCVYAGMEKKERAHSTRRPLWYNGEHAHNAYERTHARKGTPPNDDPFAQPACNRYRPRLIIQDKSPPSAIPRWAAIPRRNPSPHRLICSAYLPPIHRHAASLIPRPPSSHIFVVKRTRTFARQSSKILSASFAHSGSGKWSGMCAAIDASYDAGGRREACRGMHKERSERERE